MKEPRLAGRGAGKDRSRVTGSCQTSRPHATPFPAELPAREPGTFFSVPKSPLLGLMRVLPGTALSTYLVLARAANRESGTVRLWRSEVATAIDVKPEAVTRAFDQLVARWLIRPLGRRRRRARTRWVLYQGTRTTYRVGASDPDLPLLERGTYFTLPNDLIPLLRALAPRDLRVYLSIAARAKWRSGVARVRVDRLLAESGQSPRFVVRSIKDLAGGIIVIQERDDERVVAAVWQPATTRSDREFDEKHGNQIRALGGPESHSSCARNALLVDQDRATPQRDSQRDKELALKVRARARKHGLSPERAGQEAGGGGNKDEFGLFGSDVPLPRSDRRRTPRQIREEGEAATRLNVAHAQRDAKGMRDAFAPRPELVAPLNPVVPKSDGSTEKVDQLARIRKLLAGGKLP